MRSHPSTGRGFVLLATLALILVALSPGAIHARPLEGGELDRIRSGNDAHDLRGAVVGGRYSAAQTDTIWFGGTRWDAVDGRWEAIQDSCWTFDSGVGSDYDFSDPDVDPFKDTSLHAHMEGWIGYDNTYGGANPYFRRLSSTDPDWTTVCVGAAGGLGGGWSFYCGVLTNEADALCYASGQGYGNSWVVSIEKDFAYSGSGTATLAYDYVVDTEPGFDYLYTDIDTSHAGDWVNIASYTGSLSGSESLGLTAGTNLPAAAGTIRIRFQGVADGAYSDEDALHPSDCGIGAIDDVRFAGGAIDDFETGDDGWVLSGPTPGVGGEWSDLVHLGSLPPMLTTCSCSLEDSVLVFEDLTSGGHNQFQDNLAASPWIDLAESGHQGYPGKVIRADVYADLPLINYIFVQFNVQYYPQVCAQSGGLLESPFLGNGLVYYFGGVPVCRGGSEPVLVDFSGVVDLGAERMRIAVGVISYCRFIYYGCTGIGNSTPWFDNVKLGVFGTPGAPYLTTNSLDLPQDAWAQNGTTHIDAPARLDQAGIKGDFTPEPGTSLGDTLVVRGGSGGSEVYVQFAVDPGPGIDMPAFSSWLGSHTYEGTWRGLDWYSARLDTAIQGTSVVPGVWATLYHEDDPNFSGNQLATDPSDLDPMGQQTRKLNDIFPDNLFTPGSRVMLFYKAVHDGSEVPYTGLWYMHPDTTGGNYLEMEVLPSSTAADSTFNCILYVDHADGSGNQALVEEGLANVVAGGSDNFENTPWDRFDVRAPSSGQSSLGRPLSTQYGATLDQLFIYEVVVWDSGRIPEFNLSNEDAAILTPWLALLGASGLGFNNLYLSGDDLVSSVTTAGGTDPDALALLETQLGVSLICDTVRDASCPGSPAIQDTVACIQVDPTGGPFAGNDGPDSVVLQGNGCPELRSFDVITIAGGAEGNPVGNEIYDSSTKGPVSFHSVANEVSGGPDYKAVVDGGSVASRRDAFDCTGTGSITDRLGRVLGWFGYAGPGQSCTAAGTCFYLGAASINVPAPALCVLPNVLLGAPEDAFPSHLVNTVTVNGCTGPVIGSYVEIRFSPEADSLISWGPGQNHPIVSGFTDGNGEFSPAIIAGGCIPSGLYIPGPAATIYADGLKLGELSFTSFDMVNAAGIVPGAPGWTKNCGVTTSLADASFYGSGSPSSCYDFNGDGTPADAFDNYWFDQMMGKTTCSVTGSPEPALVDALRPAAPNPFRGATRFALSLTEPSPVRFVVYDVTGRVVRTLADGTLPAGVNDLGWDGRDETGSLVGAGLYFYRLVSPRVRETGKLVLLR